MKYCEMKLYNPRGLDSKTCDKPARWQVISETRNFGKQENYFCSKHTELCRIEDNDSIKLKIKPILGVD